MLKVLDLWLCYFFSLWPAVPSFGRIEDADCVFVQAFGRNSYTDAELVSVIENLRNEIIINETTSVVSSDEQMFELLKRDGFDPGASNLALGQYAVTQFKFIARNNNGRALIISQWEVSYAIYEQDPTWYKEHSRDIETIWPNEDYFATWHVKVESKKRMIEREFSKPLEVAQPAMITRAVPIIWSTGVRPIVEKIDNGKTHVLWVWDKDSVQPWTRSWEDWRTRELFSRIAHLTTHMAGWFGAAGLLRRLLPALPGDWIKLTPPRPTTP